MRNIFCSLVVLAVGAGILLAADANQPGKFYPGKVLKVDSGKHLLVIQRTGPQGKVTEQSIIVPATVPIGDIKPGTQYTFIEWDGKVVSIQPRHPQPVATKPPSGKGPAPTAKALGPQVPGKMPLLATAQAVARNAQQEKLAATAAVQAKSAAVKAAVTKAQTAQKAVAQAAKNQTMANQILQAREAQVRVTGFKVFRANAAATRAQAVVGLAEAKIGMAQAEAARAKAAAKVAQAQLYLTKVDAADAAQVQARAANFAKARASAAKAARQLFFQAEQTVAKARKTLTFAYQTEKQKTQAVQQAAAQVNQIVTAQHRPQAPTKDMKKTIRN